jgi:microsomal dipeptidase-like Zn-dependent dipeptidase
MPAWFQDNRHFGAIETGLAEVGMSVAEVAAIMGGNWLDFFARSFTSDTVKQQRAAE